MEGLTNPPGPAPGETVFSVPAMTCRHCVRAVSAQIRDVVGVVALEADATKRTVRVQGRAEPDVLRSAIAAAGYEAVVVSPSPDNGRPPRQAVNGISPPLSQAGGQRRDSAMRDGQRVQPNERSESC
ncbi:MAG TPA: heavy-metal-associated domain-containing protein [Acidimicrobiales bacterium]|nr:heavy-metal-associated domain-containing protein [Acidimicrobiales bacterium]